jgi:NAD(P)-dependent dehydrogenase (short-subunit alcohol dehydrogenase family)
MSSGNEVGTPIEGAVALVTGGNRGFGLAMVNELLDRGADRVYAASRSTAAYEDERIVPIALDVNDDESVAAAAEAAPDVSIVVSNAGITLGTPVLEAPLDDLRAELDTNLFGIIRVARSFAPALARHQSSSLVNVLSALSWLSFGRGYEISKAAAWSATNAMRLALHDQGTIVTALHVGFMDTDMTAGLDVPKVDPRVVADLTADAILAGDAEVLGDDVTRRLKSALSGEVTALYPQLAAERTAA